VCSILPTARHLRAGARTLYPARTLKCFAEGKPSAKRALSARYALAGFACQHFSFFVF
jgi:hypothetical protein